MSRLRAGLVLACLAAASSVWARDVAVIVGVTTYDHIPSLKWADEDARLFAQTLELPQYGFKPEDVIVLTSVPQDGERLATAANIKAAIDEFVQHPADSEKDKFVFYFSGHGVTTNDGPMLAAKDYSSQGALPEAYESLKAKNLVGRLSKLNLGVVLTIFDMCRPGSALAAGKETNRKFALSNPTPGKQLVSLFSSTTGPSVEDESLKHGVFTYYLCKALTPDVGSGTTPTVAGMESDGRVTVRRMMEFARLQMAQKLRSITFAALGSGAKDGTGTTFDAGGIGQLPEAIPDLATQQVELGRFDPQQHRIFESQDERWRALYEEALDEIENEHYKEAAQLLERAFKHRGDALTGFQASYAAHEADDDEAAERLCLAAIAADPNYLDARLYLSVLQWEKRDISKAKTTCQSVLKDNPARKEAMEFLVELSIFEGDVAAAEAQCRSAIAACPQAYGVRISLGTLLMNRGDINGATEQFEWVVAHGDDEAQSQASGKLTTIRNKLAGTPSSIEESTLFDKIKANPNDEAARKLLGDLFEKEHDLIGAANEYKAAIKINPKNVAAIIGLGSVLSEQSDLMNAEAQFRAALKIDRMNLAALCGLAWTLERRGDMAGAEKLYRERISATPKDVVVLSLLAALRRRREDRLDEERLYRAAILVEPMKAVRCQQDLSDRGDKQRVIEARLRAVIQDEPKAAKVMLALGNLLEERDDLGGAEVQYRGAVCANKRLSEAWGALGIVLEKKGDLRGAESPLRMAIATDPGNSESVDHLASLLEARGGIKDAIQLCRQSLTAHRGSALVMDHLGRLLQKDGDLRAGAEYRRKASTNLGWTSSWSIFEAQKHRRSEELEKKCRAAIKANPRDTKALYDLGEVLRGFGDLRGAERCYRAAIRVDPKNVASLNALGIVRGSARDHVAAERCYRAAIAADPQATYAMANLAWILEKRGDLAEAVKQCRTAIEIAPKYAFAQNQLGELLNELGDGKGAEKQFLTAIELDPKYAVAMVNLGALAASREDAARAEEQFRAAIKADAECAFAMANLADLMLSRGDPKGAEEQYRAAIKASPKYAYAIYSLGKLFESKGDLDAAAEQYRFAQQVDRNYVWAFNSLGELKLIRGDLIGAGTQFRIAIRLQPKVGLGYANLAEVLLRQGKREQAIDSARKAKELGLAAHRVYQELKI